MDDLALIILNYNSSEDTIFCAKQLLSFKSNFHIIVVDNYSSDDSYAKIKAALAGIEFIDIIRAEENGGYSSGNNLGMRYAAEHYPIKVVGILNPDVIIPSLEVLERMKSILVSNEQYAVIGGSTLNAEGEYHPNASFWDIPSPSALVLHHFVRNQRRRKGTMKMLSDNLAQVECVVGCFFLARLSFMQEIGYLDENLFLYNEENVLGIKCKNSGYIELLALDQFYTHNHRSRNQGKLRWRQMLSAANIGYQSRKYLCKTYYSSWLLPFLWIIEMMNRMYLFLVYLKKRICFNVQSER